VVSMWLTDDAQQAEADSRSARRAGAGGRARTGR